MSLDALVADWLHALVREEYSPATVQVYGAYVRDFVNHMRALGIERPEEVTETGFAYWVDSVAARGTVTQTRGLAVTALKNFLRWGVRNRRGFAPELLEMLPRVKVRVKERDELSDEALAALMAHLSPTPEAGVVTTFEERRRHLRALRTRALFFYLLESGCRVSEALQLPRKGWESYRVTQKGRKPHTLEVGEACAVIVREYLAAREDAQPWLWVSHEPHGHAERRLTPSGVRDSFRTLAKEAGVPPFVTHQIRHTTATVLLRNGAHPIVIAHKLGHANLNTVMRYARRPSVQQEKAATDVLDGLIAKHREAEQERPRLLPRVKKGRY